jgi:hypothetical protein
MHVFVYPAIFAAVAATVLSSNSTGGKQKEYFVMRGDERLTIGEV